MKTLNNEPSSVLFIKKSHRFVIERCDRLNEPICAPTI
ncbi:hypothetical protein HMPREF9012_0246 [Bacteroidetes bacterium oral taxon 272 str. F0290]|nr:hypothetical protein HMPREF9012_0246 [Bacteroidetes bacterium oral taxon 272 str. F0290]